MLLSSPLSVDAPIKTLDLQGPRKHPSFLLAVADVAAAVAVAVDVVQKQRH